ncbi:YggS family pyridoxal phosphate-dependent enzyme [Leminorella grimontii]|uniref:YggS family pyridoxal phosphate-dependent enzyme n=1 Tax=Leminorella grimontii TaxID=82981 RepID=UPI0020843B83|nr:YggS family pyridoxal phosphate-dependent enzyme [Leminorella grimontii]GKX60900.1 YggS family pyridoxal phosphate enzyme [Leminorella grimontii]
MTTISENLESVRQRITQCAQECGRDPKEVQLLAVSKTKPVSAIQEAIDAGQTRFGENYVQEGVEKIQHFAGTPYGDALEWHFIGPLQSNKTRSVAEHFHWMHTLDREKTARRLNEQRPENMAPLNVLIQINISDEQSKSGISLAELPELAAQIQALPRLRLRGLMTIPAVETSPERQLATFKLMTDAFNQLRKSYPQVDTLSMGMSDDMTAAIRAGSTMVRIGTAVFGARDYR